MNKVDERELKDFTWGQLSAVLCEFGKQAGVSTGEGIRMLQRGDLVIMRPERRWREENGVIYFTVVSDGTIGPEWIERLVRQGYRLSRWAKDVLKSKHFQPTTGVSYEIAVIKGDTYSDEERVTYKIREDAAARGFSEPSAEVACLIREKFLDKELKAMGLMWIAVMHEPITGSGGAPHLLSADRHGYGYWLDADLGRSGFRWEPSDGFAFCRSGT